MERSYGGTTHGGCSHEMNAASATIMTGERFRGTAQKGGCLCSSHLIDLFLTRRRTVIGAVGLTVAVAGFAVSAGAAAMT